MLFQQNSQHPLSFERSCTDPFLFKNTSCAGLELPKVNRTSTPLNEEIKKSYKVFTYDSNDIIAPAPKKPHHCSEHTGVYKYRNTRASSPWSLSTLDEDSDEDTFEADLKAELPDWSAESDAYAELLQIVNNGSPKSYQSGEDVPFGVSIEKQIPVRSIQPIPIGRNGTKLYNYHDSATHGVQNFSQLFGQSPICRTQNPLPLDSMFSPEVISKTSMYNSQYGLGVNSKDGITNSKPHAGLVHSNQQGLPLSFHKIHSRPRSLSVGARSGKAGVTF
ncbi:hypothetical protein K7432_000378 [Basidiobolus ranarum]|uniref:Uncharacterized protein n=1 Tax=Basidiobolus ranarum TaxID=34480 RepID=A0ABR2WB96_9FUNG